MDSLLKKLICTAIVLLGAVAVSASASTPEPPAVPRDYVVDLAGVIDAGATARLNALLQELEQKTTAQVLVLTVQSLDGEEIRSFGLRMAEKWKLGQKGKDNGVLIVVAVKDRKYRLEVGYGLESILPDSLVGSIGREYMVPYFRQNDYGAGVYAAALTVAQTIASSEGVEISGLQRPQRIRETGDARPMSLAQMVMLGIIALVVLVLFITPPRQCFLLMLATQMGGRGGWSGGGGGFGGGSFGGGGGGSGGGGGASGGW